MARTTKTDVVIPDVFDQAVQGAFAGKNALMGSMLAATGAAIVNPSLQAGADQVGDVMKVPYFGVLGDFDDLAADGDALTPKKLGQVVEQSSVQHSGLAFEVTSWARSASVGGDVYDEGARQVQDAVQRKMDRMLLTAARASGCPLLDVYSSTTPRTFDYDLLVDGRMQWADEQDDIVAMVVHSKVFADMLRLKGADGRPLLQTRANDAPFDTFLGIPVGISDKLIDSAGQMGAVTSAGTTPPAVTISTNTPTGPWNLKVDVITGGSRGTATFKFSTDGGVTWSAEILTAASVALVDTTVDSQVGNNGATGLVIDFAAGTYNADNVYSAAYAGAYDSLILKRGALAFWYNRAALRLETDRDILRASDVAAMHLYGVAHRYKRRRGSYRCGIVRIRHNATF